MLTKPWNLYVIRHSALTQKSKILKEHTLRDHAGWSVTSKMPQVYIHYLGNESSNSLLEAYGILKPEENDGFKSNILKPKYCPNCNESNKPHAKVCIKCKMILIYDEYAEVLEKLLSKMDRMAYQLKSADIVVVAFPMYNFSMPVIVKACFDSVIQHGITFGKRKD